MKGKTRKVLRRNRASPTYHSERMKKALKIADVLVASRTDPFHLRDVS